MPLNPTRSRLLRTLQHQAFNLPRTISIDPTSILDQYCFFFRGEWDRYWPFFDGFAITGTLKSCHQILYHPHRVGCEEFPICAEAQEMTTTISIEDVHWEVKYGKHYLGIRI
ncbi:hypothetical protein Peur_054578 [Populus x canadensis]